MVLFLVLFRFLYIFAIVLFAVGFGLLSRLSREPARFAADLSQPFLKLNRPFLRDLWLTPMRFRQLLAIEAVRHYWRLRWVNRVSFTIIALLLGALIGTGIYYLPFQPRWSWPHWLLMFGALSAVATIPLYADDSLLQGQLKKMGRGVIDSRDFERSVGGYVFSRSLVALSSVILLLLILIILGFMFGSVVVTALESKLVPPSWSWGLLCLAAAGFSLWHAIKRVPLNTERMFERFWLRGDSAYEQLALQLEDKAE